MRAQQEDRGLRDAVEAVHSEEGEISGGELGPFRIRLRLTNLGILCYVNGGGRRNEEFPHGST